MSRRRVAVQAHRAFFLNDDSKPGDYFFVKITNIGRRRVGVSHVWLDAEGAPNVHVLSHPLPAYLEPAETTEVWLSVAAAPPNLRIGDGALKRFRALLTSGKVLKSKPNRGVPAMGYVAVP